MLKFNSIHKKDTKLIKKYMIFFVNFM